MKKIFTVLFISLITFISVYSQDKIIQVDAENSNSLFQEMQKRLKTELFDFTSNKNINDIESILRETEVKEEKTKTLNSGPQKKHSTIPTRNYGNLIKSLNQQGESYYREKLDRIEYWTSEKVPAYDSLNTEIREYKTDGNGFIIEETGLIYDEGSNGMINSYKYTFENDIYGKSTIRYDWSWDGTKWQFDARREYEYDENGNKIIDEIFNWNSSSEEWYLALRTEREFNENNILLSQKVYDILNFGEGVIASQLIYSYNGDELVDSALYCNNWDSNLNNWSLQVKNIFEYNDQGKEILHSQFLLNFATNEWQYLTKYEYEYLTDGSIIERHYTFNTQTNELILSTENHYKYERQYEGDNLVEEIRLRADNENIWYNDQKIEYEYDQWGNQILYLLYKSSGDDYWELRQKQIRAYNESGELLKDENYSWDAANYILRGTTFTEYTFNEDGSKSHIKKYIWNIDEQRWDTDFTIYYSYQANGDFEYKKFVFEQNGTNNSYQPSSINTIKYDNNIGRYIEIRDDWELIQIKYNENLKVKEIIWFENEPDYGDIKVECSYDSSLRDLAWNFYREENGQWNFKWSSNFSYENLSDGRLKVTEIVNDLDPTKLIYIYNNSLLEELEWYDQEINTKAWIIDDQYTFSYNNKNQIVSYLHLDNVDNGLYKGEYNFDGNTLTFEGYYKDKTESNEWILNEKYIAEVDTTITKDQIQPFPNVLFDDGIVNSFDFHSRFDYGKIISIDDYSQSYQNNELEVQYKIYYYFSAASYLSGEAIVNGYIYDELSNEKSISITVDDNGEPIEGVIVSLCASEDDFILGSDTTDINGFYELKGVPNGSFYLKVELDGYNQTSTYELEVTEDSNIIENKNFKVQDGELVTNINKMNYSYELYPNPTTGILNLVSDFHSSTLKIYDADGRIKKTFKNINANTSIDIRDFTNGIYFIEIKTGGELIKKKIIVLK